MQAVINHYTEFSLCHSLSPAHQANQFAVHQAGETSIISAGLTNLTNRRYDTSSSRRVFAKYELSIAFLSWLNYKF